MKINPDIVFREEFDNSGILFNPDNGDTYGLNPTAAFIWKALADGVEPNHLPALLAEQTALPDGAPAEIASFVEALKEKGFLSLD